METEGNWIDLIKYAAEKDLSISTVRRYIKSNRVISKMMEGKYYIWTEGNQDIQEEVEAVPSISNFPDRTQYLQKKINELYEENQELKMLVQLYEENAQAKQPQRSYDEERSRC